MKMGSGGLTLGLIIISYIPAGIALLKMREILVSPQLVIFVLIGFAVATLAVSARLATSVSAFPIRFPIRTDPLLAPNPEPSMVTVVPTEPVVA